MINLIELLYPQVCGICDKKINERYTCRKCLNILEYYQGLDLPSTYENFFYDRLICLYPYNGQLKSKMLQLKFDGKKYIARTFADLIARKIQVLSITADYIIPVPISKKRMFERGFNQSEIICRYVSGFTGIPVNKSLIKVRNNLTQSNLGPVERKQNVIGAYDVQKDNVLKNKKVILIDDIYTTGATMNECSKVLKSVGVSYINAVTVLYILK